MNQRDIVKNIIKFGKREFNEKKPLSLQIFRVKSKNILKLGMLPNLTIKQISGIFFLVVLDYGKDLRIYYFNREGHLIRGENVEKTPTLIKSLTKETNLEYKLPKKRSIIGNNDITSHYKNQFNMHVKKLNQLFGMHLQLPNISVSQELKLRRGPMIGCKRDEKTNSLIISAEAYKKNIFEIIMIREIMNLILREFIVLIHDAEEYPCFWHDLTILFTNFYFRNEKKEAIINILKDGMIKNSSFKNYGGYCFSSNILEILMKNKQIYKTKETTIFFKNVFNCLKILKNYGIKLRNTEFYNLYFALCGLFSKENSGYQSTRLKLDHHFFHYMHFKKTFEMERNSKKVQFLVLMFQILSFSKDGETISIEDLFKEINNLNEDMVIRKEILNYQKLINDALCEYTFTNTLDIKTNHSSNKNSIELIVDIENKGNYILEEFSYRLTWKPKNRITLIMKEDMIKARDLHSNLKRKYSFSIENKGKLTFFIRIDFSHPLNRNKHLTKIIKLNKIDLHDKEGLSFDLQKKT